MLSGYQTCGSIVTRILGLDLVDIIYLIYMVKTGY